MKILPLLLFLTACTPLNPPPVTDDTTELTNQLGKETSPYLLQHAGNPVTWQAWNAETLARAERENKLLIVSVGYAACHWCHVMEHESFEDTAVARLMNDYFIPVKVDREERPDVDDIYMTACNLVSGRGGWPLNAFALPDGRPVWAGTYFPREQWMEVLKQFADLQHNDPARLEEAAASLTQNIRQADELVAVTEPATLDEEVLKEFDAGVLRVSDYRHGGRKGAPKFPMPSIYEYLLLRYAQTGDDRLWRITELTLDRMARGGIYDQAGGGFARYAVDERWMAPHFEKMLYDNGQLVSVYARAYQQSGKELYRRRLEQTLAYMDREMSDRSGSGGFYSALDADSEGEKGKFYVWTDAELRDLLPAADYALLVDYYGIEKNGNWEYGNNILHREDPDATFAAKHGLGETAWLERLDGMHAQLMEKRDSRIRPRLDDKVLTGWNALMITGYVDAFRALGTEDYRQRAERGMEFIIKNQLRPDGRLDRNYKNGKSSINGFLDDYALTIQALLGLYEITFSPRYLDHAELLTDYVRAHFTNPESPLFYYTSDIDPPLVARKTEVGDNVISSSNSVMARNLRDLGELLGKDDYLAQAQHMLATVLPQMTGRNRVDYFANWARLYAELHAPPYEIAIVGPQAPALRDEMARHFLPHARLLGGLTEGDLPLLQNKLREGETYIYVCRNKSCKLPVKTVAEGVGVIE